MRFWIIEGCLTVAAIANCFCVFFLSRARRHLRESIKYQKEAAEHLRAARRWTN